MDLTRVLLVAAAALYAGFQWTIRLVVYPQFRSVPSSAFSEYERSHQRLVSFAVGPLFGLFGALGLVAVIVTPGVATWVTFGCFATILGVTAFGAVPQHRQLSRGFDARAYRRLLRADSLRLALALLAVAVALVQAIDARA